MKKTVTLILSLLLGHFIATAQPYQSMFASGDSTTEWVFVWNNLAVTANDTAYVEKDTVVNGVPYKKVITVLWGNDEGGLLREDVNTGEVWYRDIRIHFGGSPSDTVERLAFHFGLNVGDTFDISNSMLLPGTYPDSFNIVDSIKYINGLKHIYFKGIYQPHQGGYNEPFTLIEGVGSNIGILWKYYRSAKVMGQYLLCSYKTGHKTAYHNKFYNGACQTATGHVVKSEKYNSIVLYPIPAFDIINIQNNTTEKINKIQIKSQTGQLVKEVTSLEITSVEIEEIPAGYYYLKLYTGNGYVTVKPMVVR